MPNWFYIDTNGQYQGPVDNQQLKSLAVNGAITPETILITDDGKKGAAGKLRGLFSIPPAPSHAAAPLVNQAVSQGIRAPQISDSTITYIQQDGYDYQHIAFLHRLSTWSVLTYFLGNFASNIFFAIGGGMGEDSPLTALFILLGVGLTLGAVIFSIVCMCRLATALHYGVGAIVGYAICLPLGIFGLIPLYYVYGRAGGILKHAGYRVGFIGADMRQFDATSPEFIPASPDVSRPPSTSIGCTIVVVALILLIPILIALLLPAVQAAREAARRMQCSNHQRQVVLALHTYYDVHGAFPPLYTVDGNGRPLHSWRVQILPFIEQNALFDAIRHDEPWDSEWNCQFHDLMPPEFRCPSNRSSGCCYSVIAGGSFFPAKEAFPGTKSRLGIGLADIVNGVGDTIGLVEVKEPFCWMDPTADIALKELQKGINAGGLVGSYHSGGIMASFMDGSARFISNNVDIGVLLEMGSANTEFAGQHGALRGSALTDSVASPCRSAFEDIFEAAEFGSVQDVKYFIEQEGVDVNAKGNGGVTALDNASFKNHDIEVLKYLVEKGASVNTRDDDDHTPLHHAAWYNSVDAVKYLVEKGANVNARDNSRRTPLHHAAHTNSIAVMKYLIDRGADINAQGEDGETSFHIAASLDPRYVHLAFLVIVMDENVKVQGRIGSRIGIASQRDTVYDSDVDVLKFLIAQGANALAKDDNGQTALHYAAGNSPNVDVLKFLLDMKLDVNAKDVGGFTPLHEAVKEENVGIIPFLVSQKANVNARDNWGETPLHDAARMGDIDVVKFLVSQRANVNATNDDGETPLAIARKMGHTEIVTYLSNIR